MKLTMVRYSVKADKVSENVKLIRAVYDELSQVHPAGLQYATFRAPDGVSFVHLAAVEPGQDAHPLTGQPSFQRFTAGIGERCEEPPVAVELDEVGSYSFFQSPFLQS